MVYWDEQGNTVEISKADQLWLDDGYFKTQQAHLPPDAPRAALSYRVSTKGQVDHNDIPMQKIKCRKFAQQQGWRVVMEKAEKGISGSKVSASKRDVIQELRQEAGNGSFDILLVYMFDRLGRIESETPFVLEWFVQHGIQMWSVHEGQQRIESHGDKLMNYIRFWQAAGESEKTSIRTRDRIRQIVSSGHFAGGFVPYGYRAVDKGRVNKRDQPVKDLEIDPEEAAWVREVFEKVANEGASGYAMARMLNDRGLCTRQGARFQSVNIRRMIRHEGYTGYLITKAARSEFLQELQIVDEKLFARANEVIDCRSKKLAQEKNIAAKTNNPTLLAGIVVCAHCGAKMSAFLHTDRYKLAARSGKRCRPNTTATSAARNCGPATGSRCTWRNGWMPLCWKSYTTFSAESNRSRMTGALSRSCVRKTANGNGKNRPPRRRSRRPSISRSATRTK